MRERTICFDMDGTFVDLYGVSGWLDMLINKETTPYEVAKPLYDMDEFNECLEVLRNKGFRIAIISWCAKAQDKVFDKEIRKAKRAWLKKYNVVADEIHIVRYGTPKAKTVKGTAVLIDDEAQNLNAWTRGRVIDANQNILKVLQNFC